MKVVANPVHHGKIEAFLGLSIARFALHPTLLPPNAIIDLLAATASETGVAHVLAGSPQFAQDVKTRALMWLIKMDLVLLSKPGQ
jgi:hypothetical protein